MALSWVTAYCMGVSLRLSSSLDSFPPGWFTPASVVPVVMMGAAAGAGKARAPPR